MHVWILAALAMAIFWPAPVEAQSCGDSPSPASSSSSSDSSNEPSRDDSSSYNEPLPAFSEPSSSSSASSSRSSSPTRRHRCAGDSGIVGDSRCQRFGAWDASRRRAWAFGLDIGTLRLGMRDIALSGNSMHDNVPHRWNADELRSETGIRFAARSRLFLHPNFFVGAEGAVGGVSLRGRTDSAANIVELDRALMVGGGLLAGTGVGLGKLRLDLEVAGGRRRVIVRGTSYAPDCVEAFSESFGQWTIRGGAGVSYFVRPNVSLGVHARYGFLQREVNAALSLTLHSRAYDAR
jgi:hypothetical protein